MQLQNTFDCSSCLSAEIVFGDLSSLHKWLADLLEITISRTEIISELFCPHEKDSALIGTRISSWDRASLIWVDSSPPQLCSTSSYEYLSLPRRSSVVGHFTLSVTSSLFVQAFYLLEESSSLSNKARTPENLQQ